MQIINSEIVCSLGVMQRVMCGRVEPAGDRPIVKLARVKLITQVAETVGHKHEDIKRV